jgi:hypothetical protein
MNNRFILIKEKLLNFFFKISDWIEDNWYFICIGISSLLFVFVFYLAVITLNSAFELEEEIQNIPLIIQEEMEQTRIMIKENHEAIIDVHKETRDELVKRLESSENQREQISKQLQSLKRKIELIPKPKRQKVLGIF